MSRVLASASPPISIFYTPNLKSSPPPSLLSWNVPSKSLSITRVQSQELKIRVPVSRASVQSAGTFSEDSNTTNHDAQEEEEISSAILLWRAIKLPIYSVALVPLTVGSAAAYWHTGLFYSKQYLVLLLSSILIIAWLNLSNDVYDFETGADKNKKESVVNIVGSQSVTLYAANACLLLGIVGLVWASVEAGGLRSIYLFISAILCGYVYQCPPFRLSYQGLGEPLCWIAFGPLATSAFYFSQIRKSEMSMLPLTRTVVSASFLVGFTTTLILFCSHFHQIDGDKAVGKMSPLVRMGSHMGSRVVKIAIFTLYILLFALGLSKWLPLTCIFCCALTLPMGKLVTDYVERHHNDKEKIFMAKYYCVRLHASFGAALASGLVATRFMTRLSTKVL